ncbi:MAG: hypothetical protein KAS39_01825, partial [Actinomycetia bacterium]|nr:hypothetical protein [Actinomycetes bacterium]
VDMMKVKHEAYLNIARKEIYKIFQLLEETFGDFLDESLSENEEKLKAVEEVINPEEKFKLLSRLVDSTKLVIKAFGEKTKWKWSFVEFHGRLAIIAKNMLNFKKMQEENDPRAQFFIIRNSMLRKIKELLENGAHKYRDKYELSTRERNDMEKACNFLRALRRIHLLFGETVDATNVKKGIDIWKAKAEADAKAKEEELKKKKLVGK